MNKQNFILTSDEFTKDLLLAEGFTLLGKEGNKWRFINNGRMNFSDEESKKITYTNMYNC